jgi:hypothetical protein
MCIDGWTEHKTRVAESGSSRMSLRDTGCGSKHFFSGKFDDGLVLV